MGLIYLAFYSSFFRVKNIIIENSANPEISKIFDSLRGNNIFRFNITKTQDTISQKYPEVKDVKITRGLPETLKIQFQQKSSVVVWQTQNHNYLVDSSGIIYQEIPSDNAEMNNLPLIKDNNNIAVSEGQKVLSEKFLSFVIDLNSKINEATGFKIVRLEVNETTFRVDVITDQNWKLIFDTTRDADAQLNDLKRFLTDHKSEVKEYIDLRIKGRVYFK